RTAGSPSRSCIGTSTSGPGTGSTGRSSPVSRRSRLRSPGTGGGVPVKRRIFMTAVGVAAGGALLPPPARAAKVDHDGRWAVLVDLTKCIGCRGCEAACAEANGLPEPDSEDLTAEKHRTTTDKQWTVVN